VPPLGQVLELVGIILPELDQIEAKLLVLLVAKNEEDFFFHIID